MLRKLLVLVCLIGAVSSMAQKANKGSSKATQKQEDESPVDYKQPGAPLPEFIFIPYKDTTGKTELVKPDLTDRDFKDGGSLFVMLFNPTCSHCRQQTLAMENDWALFDKTKVLLVTTPAMKPYLQEFVTSMHISQYQFITVGIDSAGIHDNLYLYLQYPQINIYGSTRKLIKSFTGDVPMDTLKKYIQ